MVTTTLIITPSEIPDQLFVNALLNYSLARLRPDAERCLSSGFGDEFVLLCRSCGEFRSVKLLVLPVTARPTARTEYHDECVQRVYVGTDDIVCLGAQ